MAYPFRDHSPVKTCTKVFSNYRKYKDFLAVDYFSKCGYCNDDHVWFNGMRGMQIDHFAPVSKFKHLEHEYDNLVYSCFYCNNNKSDDWVTSNAAQPQTEDGKKGYVHPRTLEYDDLFLREEDGSLVPQTEIAEYIYVNLCLGLERHGLLFWLGKLFRSYSETVKLLEQDDIDSNDKEHLQLLKTDLSVKFMEFFSRYYSIA
jgi:hypothetical protein